MGLLGGPWNKVCKVPSGSPSGYGHSSPGMAPLHLCSGTFCLSGGPGNGPGVGSAESHRTHLWVLRLRGVPINPPLSLRGWALHSPRAPGTLLPLCSLLCGVSPAADGGRRAGCRGEEPSPQRPTVPPLGEEREGRHGGRGWGSRKRHQLASRCLGATHCPTWLRPCEDSQLSLREEGHPPLCLFLRPCLLSDSQPVLSNFLSGPLATDNSVSVPGAQG